MLKKRCVNLYFNLTEEVPHLTLWRLSDKAARDLIPARQRSTGVNGLATALAAPKNQARKTKKCT